MIFSNDLGTGMWNCSWHHGDVRGHVGKALLRKAGVEEIGEEGDYVTFETNSI